MSKARQQSITRKSKRLGTHSNITGKEIKDLPNSTKLAKCSRDIPTVKRTNKYVVQLTKKELLRRENLNKRKLKLVN